LNFFFVSLFQAGDVVGPFLGLLDFLPGFHFLLLQESNTIGQQLGVTINAKQKDRLVWELQINALQRLEMLTLFFAS